MAMMMLLIQVWGRVLVGSVAAHQERSKALISTGSFLQVSRMWFSGSPSTWISYSPAHPPILKVTAQIDFQRGRPRDYLVKPPSTDFPGMIESSVLSKAFCMLRWVTDSYKPSHHIRAHSDCVYPASPIDLSLFAMTNLLLYSRFL